MKGTTSAQQISQKSGDSQPQIYRYIRLTELVPEILQMVDERQIAFRSAVELSYLTEGQQYTLLEAMYSGEPYTSRGVRAVPGREFGNLLS